MLIPLRHENMEGRRWPVATFALIALNIIVFLGTHWQMETQAPERAEVRMHIILLAAMHPELKTAEDVQQFIADVQRKIPEESWKQIADSNRSLKITGTRESAESPIPRNSRRRWIPWRSASPSKKRAPFWTITDSCRRTRGPLHT
jgi:hypothetical protein